MPYTDPKDLARLIWEQLCLEQMRRGQPGAYDYVDRARGMAGDLVRLLEEGRVGESRVEDGE